MKCIDCGAELRFPVATFATRPAGDEYVHSWFFCTDCDLYSRETWVDRWSGSVTYVDRIERAQGDQTIGLIAQCPQPKNDKCNCLVHQSVGVGW
jgi:hypothetical protein